MFIAPDSHPLWVIPLLSVGGNTHLTILYRFNKK